MKRVLCIKSVYRKDCGGECFTEGLVYEIFDIDTDYFNNTDIWLESRNGMGRSHIIACIKGDIDTVKYEDWLQGQLTHP